MNPTDTFDLHKAIKTRFADLIHAASPRSDVTFENDKRNGVLRATVTHAAEAAKARETLKAHGFDEQPPSSPTTKKNGETVAFAIPVTKQTRNTLESALRQMTAPTATPTASALKPGH